MCSESFQVDLFEPGTYIEQGPFILIEQICKFKLILSFK